MSCHRMIYLWINTWDVSTCDLQVNLPLGALKRTDDHGNSMALGLSLSPFGEHPEAFEQNSDSLPCYDPYRPYQPDYDH